LQCHVSDSESQARPLRPRANFEAAKISVDFESPV